MGKESPNHSFGLFWSYSSLLLFHSLLFVWLFSSFIQVLYPCFISSLFPCLAQLVLAFVIYLLLVFQ